MSFGKWMPKHIPNVFFYYFYESMYKSKVEIKNQKIKRKKLEVL